MRLLAPALLVFVAACGSHERVPIGHDLQPQTPAPSCETPGIDALQLSLLGPTDRSHWLQPWRAYRDTWPASRMTAAPGYQAPFPPDPSWSPLFMASGFKHATLEVGWSRQDYDAPEAVSAEVQAALAELAAEAKQAGLRPLLLLNAPGTSGPNRLVDLALAQPANAGDRTLHFTPDAAAQLGAHRALVTAAANMSPTLVSSVAADGTVELARPLPQALPAGDVPVKLLRYAPFTRPKLADGTLNPEYEATLAGWLAYLNAVCGAMRDALGSQAFDIELWNETAPGNNYEMFDINALYEPPLEADRPESFDENLSAIRERSATFLRAPEQNLGGMGISDGSGNMRFSGVISASEPAGISALSRHVSAQGKRFPQDANLGTTPSLDALGQDNGALDGESWVEAFTPSYTALFPEYALTGLYPADARRPAQIVRDLAPIASLDARGLPHQRAPLAGAAPAPDVWLTAASLNLGLADALGITLSLEDRLHLQSKSLLRMFSSYVGAGVGLISIYGPDQDTVRYFDWANVAGSEALAVLGRFFARFAAAADPAEPRQLELVGVSSCAPGSEFAGDGSAAHPDLDHRQLVAFFPFQKAERSFVVPTYVMTRNLLNEQPAATGPTRFDAPSEHFELRLRGLDSAATTVVAYDPLLDAERSVSVVERSGDELVIGVDLFDYPVLLAIAD